MQKPSFLIIGAQKCGSSWLFTQLDQEPKTAMNPLKETHFFVQKERPTDEQFENYLRGWQGTKGDLLGEATPSYFVSPPTAETAKFKPFIRSSFHLTAAPTIRERLGGNVKLIVSVNDPVKRAKSAFFHHVKRGRIAAGQTLSDTENLGGVVYFGFFGQHLKYWLEHFPLENFFFTSLPEIKREPESVLEKIADFLEIPDYKVPATLDKGKYVNPLKKVITDRGCVAEGLENSPRITTEELAMLREVYAEDSERFNEMVGRKIL